MPLQSNHKDYDANGNNMQFRKDQISHFILRLAYCRTEELRRWFLTQEYQLLKFRLEFLKNEERSAFMISNGMDYEMISIEEKQQLSNKLVGLAGILEANVLSTVIYK